ncbi:hypothetical protein [Flavobacterium sp. GCM10027622]|uniref:hypothetical protein n=1 Tax=unclassified Flavobacterium TaxID=196869 RepID=UPI00360C3335
MSQTNEERIQQKVEEVKQRFEEQIAKIQENGNAKIKKISEESPEPSSLEAGINATFDVKWKETSIQFDIPKFSMEKETISFDVPEVTMELKSMKFDVPATRMVRACLFKKPEVVVRGMSVTTRMTCVYGNKPEIYMKTIEIKTDIPKFTTKKMEIIFDKPVVRLETTEIVLKLPQFFLRELSTQLNEQKEDLETVGHEMTSEIGKAENEMRFSLESEVANELKKINDELREELLKERDNACKYYDDAIAKTKSSIHILKANNFNSEVARLEAELSKMVSDYQAILEQIDNGIQSMNTSISESINGLKAA